MAGRHDEPIACTLGAGDYRERLTWIARLNRDGLRAHRRDASSLTLHYGADVRGRVHQMVTQEAECCGFLTFTVDESDDRVSVTITVPERAGDMADELLAPFVPPDGAGPIPS